MMELGGHRVTASTMQPHTCLITLAVALTLPGACLADKGDNSFDKSIRAAQRRLAEALNPFDTNGNQVLERGEFGAVRKAFSAAPGGPLAALDLNHDKILADSEMTYPPLPHAKAKSPADRLKDIDTDHNGKLEGAEVEALKKKLSAAPDKAMKRLDRNSDGQLDDKEIKGINKLLARVSPQPEKFDPPSVPSAPVPKIEVEEIRKAVVVDASK